jgi:3-oxoacyl-[acyl-carrier protein] reductase
MNQKVAIVTGSTAGIGRAIAVALAKKDYIVIANSRHKDNRADELLSELQRYSPDSRFVPADVSDEKSAFRLCAAMKESVMKLDLLVNNAGVTEPTSIISPNPSKWREQFDANFFSAVWMSSGLLDLLKNSQGSVLNISSVRGLFETGREGIMAYSAAKAALNSFTKTFAKAVAPDVCVNAILPGFTATTYLERATPEQVASWRGISPIKRLIEPEEIADIAVSVGENRAMTGSLVVADGGFTLRLE